MRVGRGWRKRPEGRQRSALLHAVRTAAERGLTVRIDGSGLAGWLIVRGELCAERGRDEVELIHDLDLRAEVYEELLTLTPALFATRGELAAARSTLRLDGWGDHLLPDMRAKVGLAKPANRAHRRAAARRR